jgi:catechol 2,3-dioxygenase-like lactoylglutathione lyase family enzyme
MTALPLDGEWLLAEHGLGSVHTERDSAMTALNVIEPVVKFHLSLNVANLTKSVDFYRVLFGLEPAKRHDDYAKFELDDPPVIFSLVPLQPPPGASLSHLGFRVQNAEALEAARSRLEAAGICTQSQEGTTCGYARQDKLWVKDPDGNFWEFYCIEEDVAPETVRRSLEGSAAQLEPVVSAATWEHHLSAPVPERVPHNDNSVGEVRLIGAFNANRSLADLERLLSETYRILQPGGKVLTHGLMADRTFPGPQPTLPGLAAHVERVPVHTEPIEAFLHAGFVGVQVMKFTEKPWFTHHGAELREVKISAWKPIRLEGGSRMVLYKGPFARAGADGGWVFPRGERVRVPEMVWQQLRLGTMAEQFLFLEPDKATACSR